MYMFSCGHGHIRPAILVIAILAFALTVSSPACAGETYISANGGMFSPGADYPSDYATGLAGGLSYILVNEYAGFEFGLNGYTSSSDTYDEDIVSLGLEMLVHFHKTDSTFQPFIALGLARYRTTYTFGSSEENYTGGGAVFKLGARLYLSDKVFLGAYYKKLVNEVDMTPFKVDLGGDFIFGELGIVAF